MKKTTSCEPSLLYKNLPDRLKTAPPHLARVLTRIEWIRRFFEKLPKTLVEKHKIRVIPLEDSYPRLVILFPANQLVEALKGMHELAAEDLFSSVLYRPGDKNRDAWEASCLETLEQILPRVL